MENLEERWAAVQEALETRFGKRGDVKSTLFVIGMREWGKKKKKFSKEEKGDLMNLAACSMLSMDGYFEIQHLDADGWPVWQQVKPLPTMDSKEQENFLKKYIVKYFEEEKLV